MEMPESDAHDPRRIGARDRRKGPPAGDLVHGPVGRPDTGHRPHCRWQWSECTCWSEVGVPLPDPDTSLH
jgi:hypothetical protein